MVNNKLSSTFGSLADPTRRDILQRLLERELSVNELAKSYDMSLPAVSKHLRVLEEANLITRERRGRKHFIKLVENNFENAADHLLYYRTILNKRLDSLEGYLNDTSRHTKQRKDTPRPEENQTLIMKHIFDVPIQQLWDVYTNTKHIPEWWGPRGTTVLECENDIRPGGKWRFVFSGSDGRQYVACGIYKDVDKYTKLVYSDGFGEVDSNRPEATVTVTFAQLPDGRSELIKTSTAPRSVHQLQAAWLKVIEV